MNQVIFARTLRSTLLTVLGLHSFPSLQADNWPQYLGPERDGIWREADVTLDLEESPPKLLWSTPIDGGYSGPSVVDGRVYVMDRKAAPFEPNPEKPGTNPNFVRAEIPGTERVLCLDEKSGTLLWEHRYEAIYTSAYPYATGPRTTPLVDEGMVYTLGAEGHLHAYEAAKGTLVWRKNFVADYGLVTPNWGTSAHPVIHENLLICMVGGPNSTVVAFDKKTGKEKWTALNAREPGYAVPVIRTINGTRQLLAWDSEAVTGLDPASGKIFWAIPFKPTFAMSICAPQVEEDLVYVMAFNGRSAAIRIGPDGKSAKLEWGNDLRKGIAGVINTPYLRDGHVYSAGRKGLFRCAELATGKRLWDAPEPLLKADGSGRGPWQSAFTVHHEPSGRTLIFNDHGEMIVAQLSPKGYTETGRIAIIEPTHRVSGRLLVWSHPALANGKLFCRNDKEIRCWDLRAP